MVDNPKCTDCKLYKSSSAGNYSAVKIDGIGNEDSKIFLVGEAPGATEVIKRKPLVGQAGQFLRKYGESVGISEKNAFFTNVCRCRPPDNRTPSNVEMKKCFHHLEDEIKRIKPNVIVTLGSSATKAFGVKGQITGIRGAKLWSEEYNCWILPTYHPSYVMRFTNVARQRREFVEDLGKAKKLSELSKEEVLNKKEPVYKYAITIDTVKKAIDYLVKQEWVSFDIETSGGNPLTSQVACISFSAQEATAIVIPFQYPDIFNEEEQEIVKKELIRFFSASNKKIIQNGKFDLQHLFAQGIDVKGFAFDTMIAHYLLDESGIHNLGLLARTYTDMGEFKDLVEEYLIPDKETEMNRVYDAPQDKLFLYSAQDADATFRVKLAEEKLLKEEQLEKLFYKAVVPTAYVLARMELTGVLADKEYCDKIVTQFKYKIKELENDLHEDRQVKEYLREVGLDELNIRSSKQLRDFLFGKLGLKPVKKNKPTKQYPKGSPSTDAESLETLAKENKIQFLDKLMKYRKAKKFQDYILEYQKLAYKSPDGRIHTDYNQCRTVTGRLSSSSPNLQNIPSKDKDPKGAQIVRNCLIASPGYVLAEADYAQMEFRAWAHCSEDEKLIEFINKPDTDIHYAIASVIFKIPVEQVTRGQRKMAKEVVYGLMYGRGSWSIAAEYKMSVQEVDRVVLGMFREFPKATKWFEDNINHVREHGYIRNMFGRKRRLSDIHSKDESRRAYAERQTRNFPIQGGCADIVFSAMVKVYKRLRDTKVNMLMQIHDSLVFEIPENEIEKWCKVIKEEMENVVPMKTPLTVDIKVGKRLGEMNKLSI